MGHRGVVELFSGAVRLALSSPVWGPSTDREVVKHLVFSPGGRSLAALVAVEWSDCSYSGEVYEVRVYDATTGAQLRPAWVVPPPESPKSLLFREDGRMVAQER